MHPLLLVRVGACVCLLGPSQASLVSKLLVIVERFSPSRKWRVDTVLTMLTLSGNTIDDAVPRTAIIFIAQAEGLHG